MLGWFFVLSFQSLHIQKTWKLVPSTLKTNFPKVETVSEVDFSNTKNMNGKSINVENESQFFFLNACMFALIDNRKTLQLFILYTLAFSFHRMSRNQAIIPVFSSCILSARSKLLLFFFPLFLFKFCREFNYLHCRRLRLSILFFHWSRFCQG